MAQSSIAFRAALAVALMVGFYVLAIMIAAFLFLVPWLQAHLLGRVFLQLSLASVVSACIILWSILPRPDRFDPPGPRLEATAQPELFREIEAVATATGQPAPEEVYLVPDVNAWVAQRGGMMGFGSRPDGPGPVASAAPQCRLSSALFSLTSSATFTVGTPGLHPGCTRRGQQSGARWRALGSARSSCTSHSSSTATSSCA
jgi:Zn-dependent protease with chaperone function